MDFRFVPSQRKSNTMLELAAESMKNRLFAMTSADFAKNRSDAEKTDSENADS